MAPPRNPPGLGESPVEKAALYPPVSAGLDLGAAPPPVETGAKASSIGATFKKFVNAHPVLKGKRGDVIYQMGREYNIDPVYLAALIITQGVQNFDAAGIRYAAESVRAALEGGATYQNAYVGPKTNPYSMLPKTYVFEGWRDALRPVPGVGTPRADLEAQKAAKKAVAQDPWVIGVNNQGKLILSKKLEEPRALTFDGQPMTETDFLQLKRSLEETYVSYTGARPSNQQIQQYATQGWSVYQLTEQLSRSPGFTKSPLYKSSAPRFQAAAEGLLGPKDKIGGEVMRQAIVNQWSGETLQAVLRKRPGYVQSSEFTGRTATMGTIYESIYGKPDALGSNTIKEATVANWTPDQFASWLRNQDEYVYTPEYRQKSVTLLEQLGFLTGKVATLTPGKAPTPKTAGLTGLPNDPRITGKPSITTGTYFAPGTLGSPPSTTAPKRPARTVGGTLEPL